MSSYLQSSSCKIRAHRGAKVLNTSPFYAEAGGQVGDLGLLTNATGAELEISENWGGYGLWVRDFPQFLGIFIGSILINHGICKELAFFLSKLWLDHAGFRKRWLKANALDCLIDSFGSMLDV